MQKPPNIPQFFSIPSKTKLNLTKLRFWVNCNHSIHSLPHSRKMFHIFLIYAFWPWVNFPNPLIFPSVMFK